MDLNTAMDEIMDLCMGAQMVSDPGKLARGYIRIAAIVTGIQGPGGREEGSEPSAAVPTLGCAHGRPVGRPCPHCIGRFNNLEAGAASSETSSADASRLVEELGACGICHQGSAIPGDICAKCFRRLADKKPEYLILESCERHGPGDLTDMVTAKIAEGWRPIGGVSVAITDNRTYGVAYCQAMVRSEEGAKHG